MAGAEKKTIEDKIDGIIDALCDEEKLKKQKQFIKTTSLQRNNIIDDLLDRVVKEVVDGSLDMAELSPGHQQLILISNLYRLSMETMSVLVLKLFTKIDTINKELRKDMNKKTGRDCTKGDIK